MIGPQIMSFSSYTSKGLYYLMCILHNYLAGLTVQSGVVAVGIS